jgi:DNA-directed RNA polymerase alpha subunit
LKVRSFGKTSLREVKRKLADMGLSLGMDLNAVPSIPADQDLEDEDEDEAEAETAGATEGDNA